MDGEEVLVDSMRLEGDQLAERMGAVHALATVVLVGPRAAATAAHARALAAPLVKATVNGAAAGVTGGGGTPDWLIVSTSALLPSFSAPTPAVGAGATGRVGTFHVILQSKHIQLMTASN